MLLAELKFKMVKSKTKISKQMSKKTSPEIVETINLAKKNEKWFKVAERLSGPRKNQMNMNLDQISKESKEGDKILVPGKVLAKGEMDKKIKIISLGFSESAKEKLLNSKCDLCKITEEIKSNPEAKGIKILNNLKVTR
jgi:large subunit ribosomal protein L18e